MIIAMTVEPEDDDDIQKAVVVDLLVPNAGIICHKEDDHWVPVYLVQEIPNCLGSITRQLPPCFRLGPEASEALENVWILHPDNGEVS